MKTLKLNNKPKVEEEPKTTCHLYLEEKGKWYTSINWVIPWKICTQVDLTTRQIMSLLPPERNADFQEKLRSAMVTNRVDELLNLFFKK